MKTTSRAYNRDVSRRKALRKRRLDKQLSYYWNDGGLYNNLHQYSKNKIHCSCRLCQEKTRNKGNRRNRYGNYAPSLNYKAADRRKIDAIEASLADLV